uniref:DUF223 domain-containing protein n=1 Tax=Noccaea caerulescens TaxID=107243 RepID=A0A1J3GJD0_NOCCA
MGVELLLLDAETNAVQGFILANRLFRHENSLKWNSVNKLSKFMVRPAKMLYKVSDHKHVVCFSDLTTMVEFRDGEDKIQTQNFILQVFDDFGPIVTLIFSMLLVSYD